MYTKVTQNEKGELLAWYPVETKYEGSELDCDVIQDYSVYPHETGTFIAEYLPVGNTLGAFRKKEQAFQAICDRLNDNEKRYDMINKAQSKFVGVSLDEAYKDVNPVGTKQKKEVKTLGYIENLMNKAKERTKEMHAMVEQVRMNRNWKLGNAEYINALIEH